MPITPDTKDWTWVLERPCPGCGFDASTTHPSEVAGLIRDTLPTWEAVLRRASARERPSDDRWSPLEYACHVRDVYRLYLERLTLMLTGDDPLFANWDQDGTAVAQRYGEQDPGTVSDELVTAGRELAAAFDMVTPAQWGRRGRRSDGASFTVDTISRYLVHDPIHHLHDVGAD